MGILDKLANSMPPAALEGSQTAQIVVEGPYPEVYDALVQALTRSKMKVRGEDKALGLVHATTGMTLTSYGERFDIIVKRHGAGRTRIAFKADSKVKYLGSNVAGKYVKKVQAALAGAFKISTGSAQGAEGGTDRLEEELQSKNLMPLIVGFVDKYDELRGEEWLYYEGIEEQFRTLLGKVIAEAEFAVAYEKVGTLTAAQVKEEYGIAGEVGKFEQLLATKGVSAPPTDLIDLLARTAKQRVYERFKQRILSGGEPTLQDAANNLVGYYTQDFNALVDPFKQVLQETGIAFTDSSLAEAMRAAEEGGEMATFERQLLAGEGSARPDYASMDGGQFEGFLAELYRRMGYKVEETPLSGDQGADLIVEKFGERTAIQAKRYEGNVGNDAVQQVVASMKHYGCAKGAIVATGGFTLSAVQLAQSNGVDLIDGERLESLVEKHW